MSLVFFVDAAVAIAITVSSLYLTNLLIFHNTEVEFIKDDLPLFGNLDETIAVIIICMGVRYFGFDIVGFVFHALDRIGEYQKTHSFKTALKNISNLFFSAIGIFGLFYLLNYKVYEILNDEDSYFGHFDEILAAIVIFASMRYFGIDFSETFKNLRAKIRKSNAKSDTSNIRKKTK